MIFRNDTWNLLAHLTFRRCWNALKIVSGYFLSRITRNPRQFGMPVSIAFEPTTSCNLRCPECPSGLRSFSRPTGMLQGELFRNVIDEVCSDLFYLTFYFQGEPYLHPEFLDLVRYAGSRNIYTATSTNAHYLSDQKAKETVESGLNRLIISIDGTTQETYESYRVGGSLQKVLDGTRRLIEWKKKLKSKTPHIIFQFLVVAPNEHQIHEVKELGRSLGVDEVRFKTAQIYDYQHGSPLIPSNDRYARYREQADGTWQIKNKLLDHCWKMWHSCVITWDGKIVPCCFDKDAQHALGAIGNESFREIWMGTSYTQFRKALLKGRNQIEICNNCTEGTAIWA
ncbi:SPASM domain-containing protein [Fulvivirga sedimenti]|uniref:SPASM domain-containing protein n=1 Tax=Fulvivirga sedimenti TaxID=2879465 RepID=A0A9X1HTU0_9BACT|nr:SPASM domain-containing protein [Fulvivirga sedimenti]MCA6078193.1 SPASM domain-containing protein [Fulvivirga sedimenti]